jgi:toxic protein SymE
MEDQINERHLTVSYCCDCNESIPIIRLKGKWLRDGGFDAGTYVKVRVDKNQLVITKDPDRKKREKQKELKKLKSKISALQKDLNQQFELF